MTIPTLLGDNVIAGIVLVRCMLQGSVTTAIATQDKDKTCIRLISVLMRSAQNAEIALARFRVLEIHGCSRLIPEIVARMVQTNNVMLSVMMIIIGQGRG